MRFARRVLLVLGDCLSLAHSNNVTREAFLSLCKLQMAAYRIAAAISVKRGGGGWGEAGQPFMGKEVI